MAAAEAAGLGQGGGDVAFLVEVGEESDNKKGEGKREAAAGAVVSHWSSAAARRSCGET